MNLNRLETVWPQDLEAACAERSQEALSDNVAWLKPYLESKEDRGARIQRSERYWEEDRAENRRREFEQRH